MDTGHQIEENGWLQGAFLSADLVTKAKTIQGELVQPKAGEYFMAVSQSCDLVHGKFDAEPWCEVLRLEPIDKPDSRFSHGKNGRILHFGVSDRGISRYVQARAHQRCFLPRELLANFCPETAIECPHGEMKVVIDWLVKRYNRPALPTKFNDLVRGDKAKRKAFEELLDESHRVVSDMFIWIDPFDEIQEGASYKVQVLLVSPIEVLLHQTAKAEAEKFRQDLQRFLSNIQGLEVESVKLQSDDRTSLRQVTDYVVWDFDYLTVRDEGS